MNHTNLFVTLGFPRRWLFGGRVEFIVEQTEGFPAAVGGARKEGTVTSRELDFNVYPIRRTSLDERRPQPIVNVLVSDIAYHITPPIDALIKICKRFLDPLKQTKKNPTH